MESPPVTAKSAPRRPSPLLLGLSLGGILLVWSFNYIAAKIALRHMDALSLTALRMELAAAIMLPIFFAKGRRLPVRARDWWIFAYLAFFGIVINQGCFMFGLDYTTSQHSVIIIALGPIIDHLLAVAMRLEQLTPAKKLGMGISFFQMIALGNRARRPGPPFAAALRRCCDAHRRDRLFPVRGFLAKKS